jgi:hypothetical protein
MLARLQRLQAQLVLQAQRKKRHYRTKQRSDDQPANQRVLVFHDRGKPG